MSNPQWGKHSNPKPHKKQTSTNPNVKKGDLHLDVTDTFWHLSKLSMHPVTWIKCLNDRKSHGHLLLGKKKRKKLRSNSVKEHSTKNFAGILH